MQLAAAVVSVVIVFLQELLGQRMFQINPLKKIYVLLLLLVFFGINGTANHFQFKSEFFLLID